MVLRFLLVFFLVSSGYAYSYVSFLMREWGPESEACVRLLRQAKSQLALVLPQVTLRPGAPRRAVETEVIAWCLSEAEHKLIGSRTDDLAESHSELMKAIDEFIGRVLV